MERQLISNIAHNDHPIAAPISEAHIDRLLTRAKLPAGARILDLGCGRAAWSLRALALYPDAVADGVDVSEHVLAAAKEAASAAGVADRLRLHHIPAADFPDGEPYDLVLCVGSTHAFGGLEPALREVRRHLKPGGRALVGEGFWETRPSAEALEKTGMVIGEFADLPETVAQAERSGYRVVYAHVSDRAEWYDYEWSWTGTLIDWALDHPGPDGDAALAAALDHRDWWLNGTRDLLGFVTLLLRHADGQRSPE